MMEENKALGDEPPAEAPAKVTQEAKANLDLPFDLNNLFNMQYSFDVLKEAIEFLAKQQAEMNARLTAQEAKPAPEYVPITLVKETEVKRVV